MRSTVILKPKNVAKNIQNKKSARLRRQRGYHWEDTLVKRFNALENWKAFRLGSPSVALPDILCVNNINRIIFTIEAKSGTSTSLTVPFDQIIRCMNWTENFQVYEERRVILAFKFLSKKRIGTGIYEKRQLREFFKVWNIKKKPIDIVCRYDGTTYALNNGKKQKLSLKNYEMPFKTKRRKK